MKILSVCNSDKKGGAARAAYRLHQGLRSLGGHSKMLVGSKFSDDPDVIGPSGKIKNAFPKIRQFLDAQAARGYRSKNRTIFSTGWVPSGMAAVINGIDADVVHLHWVAGGLMQIEDLLKIKSPIVWSFHDMWPFSGGCHYDGGCGKYRMECGKCPVLNSCDEFDLSRKNFIKKKEIYSRLENITFVGLSKWMAECAKQSSILSAKKIINLPNPIDLSFFRPVSKRRARQKLGFPQDKKIIAFGAMDFTVDPNKGYFVFSAALGNIQTRNVKLAIFGYRAEKHFPYILKCWLFGKYPYPMGNLNPFDFSNSNLSVNRLGSINDDQLLKTLYSAADVVVVPSLQENLSNIIMESLACGTPVVAFDAGGNKDMIIHKRNGYLAEPHLAADLAHGIDWVLGHPHPDKLKSSAVNEIERRYESKRVAADYYSLYEHVLEKTTGLDQHPPI